MLLVIARSTALAALLAAASSTAPSSAPRATAGTTPAAAAAARGEATTPDAAALLARVGEVYRGLTTYHFAGTTTITVVMTGQNQVIELPFRLALESPGKARSEVMNPMFQLVQVWSGDTLWTLVPQLEQYTRQALPPRTEPANPLAQGTPLVRYPVMSENLAEARIEREETVQVGKDRHPCWVVRARYDRAVQPGAEPSPTTFWIDRTRHLVLRESTLVTLSSDPQAGAMRMTHVTHLETAQAGEALPAGLFTFVPPAGARPVERLDVPGQAPPEEPELVGKAAIPFTLKNLAGKSMALGDWKGKVVLLDFWASWCGPCRVEMPTVAKLDRELRSKGLVVAAVNVGESAAVASRYLKRNKFEGMTVLLDSDSEVSNQYGASAIPTVVIIDRQGTISSYFTGVRSEQVLREALRKAGID